MIKCFCDGCHKEIVKSNAAIGGFNTSDRLGVEVQRNGKKLKLELMHSYDGKANEGHWCKYCILDAFKKLDDRKLDDRPKAAN